MKKVFFISLILFCAIQLPAKTIAIFPVEGVNIDKSFADAFGALLANKYEKLSGDNVIGPAKAGRAIKSDSNLISAASILGADEYIEISAIGLYLSHKEKMMVANDSATGQRIVIINENQNNSDEDDDDDDDNNSSDQAKLDNQKTIVTAKRFNNDGELIFKAEMTLIVYGDIEESTDRIARSLINKLPVEQTRTLDNITRREGLGHNKLFVDNAKGFKMGMFYPAAKNGTYSPVVTIGYNQKLEAEKFFLEFGIGGRIPSEIDEQNDLMYGGNYFEMGGCYYVLNSVVGVYAGGGIIPYFNWVDDVKMEFAPYLQMGMEFPRNSGFRFFMDVRVAQNVLPIVHHHYSDYYDEFEYSYEEKKIETKDYPTEFGLQIGIAW